MQDIVLPVLSIDFSGFVNDGEWPHFLWLVKFSAVGDGAKTAYFFYKTGIGHATPYVGENGKPNKKPICETKTYSDLKMWLHVPTRHSILHALFSDAAAAEPSFDMFCAEFGYDTDSISAFNTYRACEETRKKLLEVYQIHFEKIKEEALHYEV